MAAKKKDPYSTQGLNDKASVQQALASAQYQPGEAVNNAASALEQWQASRPGAYQSQYQGQINDLLDQAMNQEKFSYNYASDPLYRQYAQAYRQNAHDASTDAAAQAAALTGGYGSSYATSAAQQAYQQQMNGLNSVIPTLYSLALDSYTSEGDLLMDQIGALNQQEQNAQDLYYRQLDDYYTQLEQKQDAYESAAAPGLRPVHRLPGQPEQPLRLLHPAGGGRRSPPPAELQQRDERAGPDRQCGAAGHQRDHRPRLDAERACPDRLQYVRRQPRL